jgi:hypothetical protein
MIYFLIYYVIMFFIALGIGLEKETEGDYGLVIATSAIAALILPALLVIKLGRWIACR